MNLTVFNNGKGWLIGNSDNHWIVYDKNTNKFYPGWGTYFPTKEEAEKVKATLINE